MKIDGVAALSFAIAAAEKHGTAPENDIGHRPQPTKVILHRPGGIFGNM
ncbi:MAG: hypothetical protein ACM3TN_17550 [Alphaproteobacteria bacterium]